MTSVRRRAVAGTAIGVLALAVLGAVHLFGLSAYRIASGSMEPDFPVDSIVVDSSAAGLELGRAITFVADGAVVTHVFTGYASDGSLVTRGTANASDDVWRSPVYPRDVRGRVLFALPFFAPSFWREPRGVVVAATVGAALLAVALWRYARRVEREVATQNSSDGRTAQEPISRALQ